MKKVMMLVGIMCLTNLLMAQVPGERCVTTDGSRGTYRTVQHETETTNTYTRSNNYGTSSSSSINGSVGYDSKASGFNASAGAGYSNGTSNSYGNSRTTTVKERETYQSVDCVKDRKTAADATPIPW